ncbi:MAG TPA: tail fiber domain-containing protein [Pyrinomonadaceae bacterium]|jgi:hypothetical protein|nr:tail fiber domain-containing protein [Pyrinomonadaceae bacterium]
MKSQKTLAIAIFTVFVLAGLQTNTLAQAVSSDSRDTTLASLTSAGSSIRLDAKISYASATLTISGPDGRVFTREFKSGSTIDFTLSDNDGARLPDGVYTYELRLAAASLSKLAKEARRDDAPEALRASRKQSNGDALVQSGSFSIVNGATYVPGAIEGNGRRAANEGGGQSNLATPFAVIPKTRHHHPAPAMMFDFVIADDLIVQGSACVGLDCVNGEVFGFDTIRVKENNTRIQFDDTSTSAGFATNNWQIRANSSASGGASFLAFVDQGGTGNSETGTIVFEVDAGAPANSLRVSSGGNVGVGTATPVLDVHVNTTDTPAMRFEQNNSGGFTAQTWDVAANEANFFVRDVTSGSRLPFRIRPGAPTSSIDIAANGFVGIGTASPTRQLQVHSAANTVFQITDNVSGSTSADGFQFIQAGVNTFLENQEAGSMTLRTSATDRVTITSAGSVGILTTAPTATLSVNGTANKPGGGSWDIFSDERLKNIKGRFNRGLNAVLQLQPLRYEYKRNNGAGINSAGEYIGFGAQAVQQVVPEAVSRNANGYLQINNDPIIWTMLNAIKEQQIQIEQLKGQIRQLRAASRRRR